MSNGQINQAGGLLTKNNAKAVWRYATRPDILPRIRGLGIHFGHFAYLIALVLQSARLIPAGHPCLNPAHIGRFGVRYVLALAASQITWSWKNTDQIAIFGAVVIGLIMTVIQAFVIAAYALMGTAHASASTSVFSTPDANVSSDVVLIFLEQVFGPNLNLFGAATQPLGTPVYKALHAILALYSTTMMIIAAIIIVYYLTTVVAEAAKSGTPFGKRFDSLWAPIRLVIALGLLVPLGTGLNSAQYLTLWLAKMGSGFGTTVWTTFVEEITEATDIVTKPSAESTTALVQRVFFNEVCAASFNQIEEGSNRSVKILQVLQPRKSIAANLSNPDGMVSAAQGAGLDDVVLSWSAGEAGKRATDYACGKMSISLTEFDMFSDGKSVTAESEKWWWNLPLVGKDMDKKLGGIHADVKNAYIKEIGRLSEALQPAAKALAAYNISINKKSGYGDDTTLEFIPDLLKAQAEAASENINTTIASTYEDITQSQYAKSGGYDEMVKRGWGAAGLWYGTLGTINKKYMDALASAVPTLDVLFTAENVQDNERGPLARFFGVSRYDLSRSSTDQLENTIIYASENFAAYVPEVVPAHQNLYTSDMGPDDAVNSGQAGWLSRQIIGAMGAKRLRQLQEEPTLDPLARLTAAGHGMVRRSLIFAGVGGALGIGGSVLSGLGTINPNPVAGAGMKAGGEAAGAIAGFMFIIAGIGLAAGVFLAYILPLIPFVYFAFAIIGWVLEIFEAIIAMPLWALAHLRIEEGGMPGPGALPGYQLLFMILLRPTLIVFGLVGGYVIFGAATYFFTSLFTAATAITQSDLVSNQSVGAIGVIVYVVMYAFLIYNIALMCFKMIDDVPKGILRWMGSGAQTFSDSRGDPIEGSRAITAAGVATAIGLSRGVTGTTAGLKGTAKNFGRRRKNIAAGRDMEDDGRNVAPKTDPYASVKQAAKDKGRKK
ncbi:MAG: DotA/TraY family protein [Alphaproteobacteria bacterium]|nr:DotA/TraY family protein [Alphaproteobacteria bacterium]MBU1278485.1 DotA/TraY family protein [Alphaproteobacteria bacterium]MBU1573338.1 DotA/TraY family protein [Alphaproteobacteria bacterium]MBU1830038.1 DotA/TraY family protein [Alphaproteobacteria bacterium]MBU2241223.1 DotA/TraY family protein [Alphaproteobacteria bacterium]